MCASCDRQLVRKHDLFCSCSTCRPEFSEQKFHNIQRQLIDRGLHFIGQGCGRVAYVSPSGRFVYKVPINIWGLDANLREHQIYRHEGLNHPVLDRSRVARCRLAPSGVLVMELVKTGSVPMNMYPKWAGDVDGYQVGWNRANNCVAYDYGYE